MNEQYCITIRSDGQTIFGTEGESIKNVLERSDFFFPNNCGGDGKCLSCRIEYINDPPPITYREAKYFAPGSNYRMACQQTLTNDITISLNGYSVNNHSKSIDNFTVVGGGIGYGIAVDLGTTQVAVYVADLSSGQIIGSYSLLNPQMRFGGDVMSRLQSAKQEKLLKQMTNLIHKRVREVINHALTRLSVEREEVARLYLCGNSAMTHFWLGHGGEGLERAPFRSIFESKGPISFDPVLIGLTRNSVAEIAPILSGYVGGDTAAAIIVTDLDIEKGNRLLIDFGTNGEIVLSANGQLTATSTAAGPAFEGVGMRSGIPATSGAIEGFHENGIPIVIGSAVPNESTQPIGFCGSGYISALNLLLKRGIMSPSGLLEKNANGNREWSPMDNGLPLINQEDVRQFQLAKAAIAAGIEILCKHADIDPKNLEEIILTGSFGSKIDPLAAINIGLIPDLPLDKITFINNGAGRGAALCLSDERYRQRATNLQKMVTVINLGEMPEFQDMFVENMTFPVRHY